MRAAALAAGRADIVVESRGTAAYHEGKGADPRTVAHAARRGLDLKRHRARQVTVADVQAFDVVYAMDRQNLADLRAMAGPEHAHKLALFLGDDEVPDPWSGGAADFERVLDLCVARAAVLVKP